MNTDAWWLWERLTRSREAAKASSRRRKEARNIFAPLTLLLPLLLTGCTLNIIRSPEGTRVTVTETVDDRGRIVRRTERAGGGWSFWRVTTFFDQTLKRGTIVGRTGTNILTIHLSGYGSKAGDNIKAAGEVIVDGVKASIIP